MTDVNSNCRLPATPRTARSPHRALRTAGLAAILVSALLALGCAPTLAETPNPTIAGCPVFPQDNIWNTRVDHLPVDPRSQQYVASIGADQSLRADFASGTYQGAPVGIPFIVVPFRQPKVTLHFQAFGNEPAIPEESDHGPYPIPRDAPIEGGSKGTGDRHILVLDRDNWMLYELFNAFPDGKGGWKAGSGAIWDLKKNQVRPDRWTSADAAGLPILPGLVRYDEVVGKKSLNHALRFTVAKTRRAYIPPASHWASQLHDDDLPPMGMRMRLRADYDLSGFSSEARTILQALKTYGMILADNGTDNFISGAPDPRWNMDALRQLRRVTTKDLEIVQMRGMVVDPRR